MRNKEKQATLLVPAIDSRLTIPLDAIVKFGMTSLEIASLMACSGFVHGAVAFGGSFSADGPGWGAIGLFFFEGRVARSRPWEQIQEKWTPVFRPDLRQNDDVSVFTIL